MNDLDPRFMELASRFLDGAASPQDLETLDAILKSDPRAAGTLAELLNQHGTLAMSLRGEAAYKKQLLDLGSAPARRSTSAPSRRAWWMVIPIAACIAVILTVILAKREQTPVNKMVAAPAPRTLSFQDGVAPTPEYRGSRDTKLAERRPNQSFAYEATLEVEGPGDEGESEALLAWDLSQIPPGSKILSAEITLSVAKSHEREALYQVWDLRQAWSEDQATWNTARSGSLWEVPGAKGFRDRGPAPLAEFRARKGSLRIALEAVALETLERWVRTPSQNHGILLSYAREPGEFYLGSRRAELAENRPRLTITYLTPER